MHDCVVIQRRPPVQLCCRPADISVCLRYACGGSNLNESGKRRLSYASLVTRKPGKSCFHFLLVSLLHPSWRRWEWQAIFNMATGFITVLPRVIMMILTFPVFYSTGRRCGSRKQKDGEQEKQMFRRADERRIYNVWKHLSESYCDRSGGGGLKKKQKNTILVSRWTTCAEKWQLFKDGHRWNYPLFDFRCWKQELTCSITAKAQRWLKSCSREVW